MNLAGDAVVNSAMLMHRKPTISSPDCMLSGPSCIFLSLQKGHRLQGANHKEKLHYGRYIKMCVHNSAMS